MKKQSLLFSLSCLALGNLIFSNSTAAQVTTDGTTNTTVNSDNNGNFTIEQGDRAGSNLFHSFGDFSVPTNGSAFFNNATDVSNIFSRVTGGNISDIDGLIGANGSANLFLINPAGILFGNNARLDIGGSFFGTTADSILFEDGEFSATNLDNPPLLTINAPIGLNFRDNPNGITNSSFVQNEAGDDLVGLEVAPGENLTLVGGDVTFDAGEATAPGGRIQIGGLSEAGTVTIELDNTLTFPEGVARANVFFTNAADIDVRSEGGGSIFINANNIEILEGSNLQAGILEGSQLPNSQAGDIILNAEENIRIASSNTESTISNQVGNIQGNLLVGITTQGSAGNIIFNSNTFEGNGNFDIRSVTSGAGDAGQININARESVSFVGSEETSSGVLSAVGPSATGNGGNVTISTPSLSIFNSNLLLSTIGNGNTGDLRIEANDSIAVSGISQFQSTSFGNGDAGNIIIDAPNANITFDNPTTLVATSVASVVAVLESAPELATTLTEFGIPTISTGSSGDITVTGRNLTLNDGARFFTTTAGLAPTGGLANAGNITINVSDNFTLSGNSQLQSGTSGQGNAGDVNITAGGQVSFEGSNIRTAVDLLPEVLAENFDRVRQGGDINVTANSLSLTNGSQVFSNTFSSGDAGDIEITARDGVSVSGFSENEQGDRSFSQIRSGLETGATGSAGDITIDAGSLTISDGAFLSSSTFGTGNAGNVRIDVQNAVSLTNNAQIFSTVEATAVGNSSGIDITTTDLGLTQGSQIDASTSGQGNAGAVTISTTGDISADGENSAGFPSGIFSSVNPGAVGNAGGINITTNDLTLSEGSVVNGSTFGEGNAGAVTINATGDISASGEDSAGFSSGIFSSVNPGAVGNAGGINIATTDLILTQGGAVTASTFAEGNAGAVTINATGNISASGENSNGSATSGIFSTVETFATGDSGEINITTNDLTLSEGSVVNGSTSGQGNAGAVTINATGDISASGEDSGGSVSGVFSRVNELAIGNSGGINIDATDITLTQGAVINASTFGRGNAGAIAVDTSGNIFAEGTSSVGFVSGIFSVVGASGVGDAAGIDLNTNDIFLTDNAGISVSSGGEGNAANLTINSASLILSDGAFVTASTPIGTGGSINLQIADRITLRDNSLISAQAFNNANGGNLTIDTDFIIAFPGNNDIIANAEQGRGGVITIDAESLLGIEERLLNDTTNDINASSEDSTLDGDIFINTSDVNPAQGATELPTNPVEPEQSVTQACSDRDTGVASTLRVTGRGGVPTLPVAPLSSETITVGGESAASTTNSTTIATENGNITLARGVIKTADGQIILTPTPVNGSASRTANGSLNCS